MPETTGLRADAVGRAASLSVPGFAALEPPPFGLRTGQLVLAGVDGCTLDETLWRGSPLIRDPSNLMTTTPEEQRTENDKRVAKDVARYGCHVISVFDPEEKLPTFSYSVGIQASSGAPEAIVIGVRPKLGHSMINEYNDQIRKGVQFERGTQYDGFLEGFKIYVEPAKPDLLSEYTLGCTRFYEGAHYGVVQLIYPTTSGIWPWQKEASDWFRSNQPMLGRKHPQRR